MKRLKISIILAALFGLCACDNNYEPNVACQINASRVFDVNGEKITHSLYIEKEEDRFIWSLTCPEEFKSTFYFDFSNENIELYNDDQFDYITSNNEIVEFEETYGNKSCYNFTGPIVIYIYYNNASQEIKNIIDSNTYYIEISSLDWFSEPSLFD